MGSRTSFLREARCHAGRAALAVCAVCLTSGLGPLPSVSAQEAAGAPEQGALDPGETLLGIIDIFPSILPDRLVPKAAPESDARSPDELYAAAMTELRAERFEPAQRLFELFVARDPLHPSASEARRHLSELYRLHAAAVSAAASAETAATLEAAAPQARAVVRRVAAPRSVGGRLEDSFMLDAGDRVFFAARSADLGSRARAVLAAQARWLKRNASLSAVIEGHSDDPALDATALDRLAAERAEAVYNRLLEEGVEPERLAIAAAGRTRPVAPCASSECAAQNRRAVTVLTVQSVSELPAPDASLGSGRP